LLPVAPVAGKSQHLPCRDRTDLAEADLGNHSVKAGACDTAGNGPTKIVVYRLDVIAVVSFLLGAGTRPWASLLNHKGELLCPSLKARPSPRPTEKAGQGEIILRTRTQGVIFLAGLVGAVLLALVLKLAGVFGA
jgi:hypothetical protein